MREVAGVYWEWSKKKRKFLFCAALRVRFCITHARCNEVIVASERTSGQACHILGDGNRPGITIARIAKKQIVEGWDNWDQLGMLKQIGAYAPPQATLLKSA
jgi:hypothetical protein